MVLENDDRGWERRRQPAKDLGQRMQATRRAHEGDDARAGFAIWLVHAVMVAGKIASGQSRRSSQHITSRRRTAGSQDLRPFSEARTLSYPRPKHVVALYANHDEGITVMHALIVYESMYGNTHAVANHIADGLRSAFDVTVVPVAAATDELLARADLLVCGGPTHAHGMSGDVSRHAAIEAAGDTGSDLEVDGAAAGPGLREWFHGFEHRHVDAAAFDTRYDGDAAWTGRASLGITHRLRRHGYVIVAAPESFLVDAHSHLRPGEAERAVAWGAALAAATTFEGRQPV